MPIPRPQEDETKNEFLHRCLSFLKAEGTTGKQAVAICFSKWRSVHGGEPPTRKELNGGT